jgi:hypothetical protein
VLEPSPLWLQTWRVVFFIMSSPVTTLEFRKIEIPRSRIIDLLERETGKSNTREHRHFLAGEPVHCGDFLELFENGAWIPGRYEWTCQPGDPPTLHFVDRILWVEEDSLLRWPKQTS